MYTRRRISVSLLGLGLLLATVGGPLTPTVHATPVCAGPTVSPPYPPPCPRVFPEPAASTNWIQFGPDTLGRMEFADGVTKLQQMYPQYVKLEKLSDVLHDKWAVSIGTDGVPPWDPHDTGDGQPVYVAEVTDFNVPDAGKAYTIITEAHSAEPCGREAAVRTIEDLAMWGTDGQTTLDNATGPEHKTTTMKVADLLKHEHIFFMMISPDGWRSGDQDFPNWIAEQQSNSRPQAPSQYGDIRFTYSEENGRGVNSNREAPSVGWIFRQPKGTYPANSPGLNPALTEPEAIASWKYISMLQERHGGSIDAFMDIHGPLPFPADIMLPDGMFDPHREQLMQEMALRVKQNMDASVGRHLNDPGLYDQLRQISGGQLGNGPTDWTTIGQAWDLLSYTVTGAWGFWMAQPDGAPEGIGTDYENNCYPGAQSDFGSPAMQFFIDSARAAIQTTLVQALAQKNVTTNIDTKGQVGYIDNPTVLTQANNHFPPSADFPGNTPGGNPYFPNGFQQHPYAVSSMQYLKDTSKWASSPFVPVNPSAAVSTSALSGLDTLVLVNHPQPPDATGKDPNPGDYYASLRNFVENGGNLVLTDGAIKALVGMGVIPNDAVKFGTGYVGYVDIQDFNDPLVKGVVDPAHARRMTYDPVSVGYEIRAERDGHWASGTPDSQTANMAPIWMVDRPTWEKLGGHTVATTDPLNNPKATRDEGSNTDKVSLGYLPLGKGRISFFGAILPDPTDQYYHPFGLGSYGATAPAQTIFQRMIAYVAPGHQPVHVASVAAASASAPSTAATSPTNLPNTTGTGPLGAGIAAVLIFGGLALTGASRRRRRARR